MIVNVDDHGKAFLSVLFSYLSEYGP
jgi:hypothetical protein